MPPISTPTGTLPAGLFLLEDLTLALLVRERRGRLCFANRAAREQLSLAEAEVESAGLTSLGEADGGVETFLLTLDQAAQRPLRGRRLRTPIGSDLDLVQIEPDRDGERSDEPSSAGPRSLEAIARAALALRALAPAHRERAAAEAMANLRRHLGEVRTALAAAAGVNRAPPRTPAAAVDLPAPRPTRVLCAEVTRRLRRHLHREGRRSIEPAFDLPRSGGRPCAAPAIEVARILLHGLELLGAGTAALPAVLRGAEVGCRLRLVLDAESDESGESAAPGGLADGPDLRHHDAVVRELAPALRRLGAIFELHRDQRGLRRVILSLPTAPPRA